MMIATQSATLMSPTIRTPRRQLRATRSGASLIELMVVMTGVAVVLGLCTVTIQALMRVNADARAGLNSSATFARLASQFRDDVHASDDIQFQGDSKGGDKPGDAPAVPRLRLTREAGMVIGYEATGGRVTRVESAPGKTARHESYRIGKDHIVVFEGRDEGPLRFVAMVMSRDAGKGQIEPPRPIEVLALRGKDRHVSPLPRGDQPK